MLASNSPAKIPLPFANSGTKNTIPTASQVGITPGAASLTDGFPPLTFTPLSAGGIPPAGADFNGILNQVTAIQQWQSAGGSFKYDAAFSTAVGGYPKGSVLSKLANNGFWQSTVDNNTTNPDSGGANWVDLGAGFGGRPGHTYATNDWAYLDKAGGLIVQWGSGNVIGSGYLDVVFPAPFTVACFCALTTSDGTGSQFAYVTALTKTGCVIDNSPGVSTNTVWWLAIGI